MRLKACIRITFDHTTRLSSKLRTAFVSLLFRPGDEPRWHLFLCRLGSGYGFVRGQQALGAEPSLQQIRPLIQSRIALPRPEPWGPLGKMCISEGTPALTNAL